MIGDFKFSTYILSDMIADGWHVSISKWEKPPVSAMFTANLSGKRHLTGLGHNLNVGLEITNLTSEQVTTLMTLNGMPVEFKIDKDDNIIYQMNCVIEPHRADGRPFYNAASLSFSSITSNFETSDHQLSATSPFQLKDSSNPEPSFWVMWDNGVEKILEYSE